MTTTSRKSRFFILSLTGCLLSVSTGTANGGIATEVVSGLSVSTAACGQVRSLTDRRDADVLLKRARQALDEGNLELTEWYVSRAEGMEVEYDSVFERFVDTPEKVREAMMQYRATVPQPIDNTAAAAAAMTQARSQIVDSAKSQATNFLSKGQAAIAGGDLDKAIGWYQSAVATGAQFTSQEYSPQALAAELANRGVDASQMIGSATTRIPAAEMVEAIAEASLTDPAIRNVPTSSNALLARGTEINDSTFDQGYSQKRVETMRLLAQAEVALDRGDLAVADRLVQSAKNINLPENQYRDGDTRPWMLLMEITRRQGRVATAKPVTRPNLAPTPDFITGARATQRDPLIDQTRNVLAGAEAALTPPTGAIALNIASPTAGIASPLPARDAILTGPMLGGVAPEAPAAIPSSIVLPPHRANLQPANLNASNLPPANLNRGNLPPATLTPEPVPTPANTVSDLTDDLLLTDEEPANSLPAPIIGANDFKPQQAKSRSGRAPVLNSKTQAGEGANLFRDGEQALLKRDFDRARALFAEAWALEDELDVDTRQRLQDYLQTLRLSDGPNALDGPAPPALLGSAPTLSATEQRNIRSLLDEMSRQQATINAIREKDPMGAWNKIKVLRKTVAEADVNERMRSRLLGRVDRAMQDMESYIDTNRSRIENDAQNKKVIAEVDRRREKRIEDQQTLAEFVEQFNELLDQQRFSEASIVAKKAAVLEPNHPTVETMVWKAQVARQIASNMARDQKSQEDIATHFGSIDRANIPMVGNIEFPDRPEWEQLTHNRQRANRETAERMTDAELEIHRALKKNVDVNFINQPISVVVEKLSQMSGVNFFLDPEGLSAEGVTSDTTVSLNLRKPVTLRSALNLILSPLHLSYIVQDEVLRVTTEQARDGDVRTRTYNVADLVIPIPNFDPSNQMGLPAALREGYRMANEVNRGGGYNGGYQRVPYVIGENSSGAGNQNASVLAQMGLGGSAPQMGAPMSPVNVGGGFNPTGGAGGAAMADFDTLIELVTTTVAPETWEEVGGTGSIAGFPTNLSLVVAQTQEVHEKIVDLLAQLRRLQDLQVTIEVRFITLNDDFFERMGVDFDFDVDDNTGLSFSEVQALDDSGPSITVGLDPVNRIPTVDLDVGFNQGSFAAAVPTFGGFDAASAATVGFAILSDIEAFFVIEAAQGDTRTNVLQAPKVTLFNGQQAFIADQSQRPFVTSIIPVVGDFAAAHQPVITVLTEGTSLSVQAVVSQDRRFVRLTLVPFFSRIGAVETFTFDGSDNSDTGTNVIDPTDQDTTVVNNRQNSRAGTTVQLPTFSFTSVTTTVSVPDGGTILLGGIKRLTEGRTERGVPMLSKLPYINRLFKNVGIGRETESLMMMVTPRIIIQEEEEEKLGISLP